MPTKSERSACCWKSPAGAANICVHILLHVSPHTRFCRQVVCVCVCVYTCERERERERVCWKKAKATSAGAANTCVLILLYTTPLIHVSACYYICVGILVYGPQKGLQNPHIPHYEFSIYVSSYYYYMCVSILLYVCPPYYYRPQERLLKSTTYVSSYYA